MEKISFGKEKQDNKSNYLKKIVLSIRKELLSFFGKEEKIPKGKFKARGVAPDTLFASSIEGIIEHFIQKTRKDIENAYEEEIAINGFHNMDKRLSQQKIVSKYAVRNTLLANVLYKHLINNEDQVLDIFKRKLEDHFSQKKTFLKNLGEKNRINGEYQGIISQALVLFGCKKNEESHDIKVYSFENEDEIVFFDCMNKTDFLIIQNDIKKHIAKIHLIDAKSGHENEVQENQNEDYKLSFPLQNRLHEIAQNFGKVRNKKVKKILVSHHTISMPRELTQDNINNQNKIIDQTGKIIKNLINN